MKNNLQLSHNQYEFTTYETISLMLQFSQLILLLAVKNT